MANKIPPRALNAANRILARIPSTHWTPQERDVAAAIIGMETGQEKALEACRKLLSAFSENWHDSIMPAVDRAALEEGLRLASLALRR